jgi:hypothetical protein
VNPEQLAEIKNRPIGSMSADAPHNPDIWTLAADRDALLAEVEQLARQLARQQNRAEAERDQLTTRTEELRLALSPTNARLYDHIGYLREEHDVRRKALADALDSGWHLSWDQLLKQVATERADLVRQRDEAEAERDQWRTAHDEFLQAWLEHIPAEDRGDGTDAEATILRWVQQQTEHTAQLREGMATLAARWRRQQREHGRYAERIADDPDKVSTYRDVCTKTAVYERAINDINALLNGGGQS